MGKTKANRSPSAIAVCQCEHPFQCQCGHRPERPSKGHKWDPIGQQWTGKGHKQRGASGQTAATAQAAKLTSLGNVSLKQWQKLPSQLLADLCQKAKKGTPSYRRIPEPSGRRFQLCVPDRRSTEHDVLLAPSLPVANEEQAREEAALLGLVYLFPDLPHDRTLPEPYRTTYLAARSNTKSTKSTRATASTTATIDFKDCQEKSFNNKRDAAFATCNMQLTATQNVFGSMSAGPALSTAHSNYSCTPLLLTIAQRKEAQLLHQRQVQATIRKHEAIRNANRPVQVFMSASMRRRIEQVLTGKKMDLSEEEEELEQDESDNNQKSDAGEVEEDITRSYVLQRLVHEGFTPCQVRKAYRAISFHQSPNTTTAMNNRAHQDQQMDDAYEQTLQYLCIHLKEDQLPIGFDPRGGTLDVVVPPTKQSNHSTTLPHFNTENILSATTSGNEKDVYSLDIRQFAQHLGLTLKESYAVLSLDESLPDIPNSWLQLHPMMMQKWKFWKALSNIASLSIERTCLSYSAKKTSLDDDCLCRNQEAAENECDALASIFDSNELTIRKMEDCTLVLMSVPFRNTNLVLEVFYPKGVYPDFLPMVMLTTEIGNAADINCHSEYSCGGSLHLKIVQFLSTLTPSEVILLELFWYVKSLLEVMGETYPFSDSNSQLLCQLNTKLPREITMSDSKATRTESLEKSRQIISSASKHLEKSNKVPQERRNTFWTLSPLETPPAESFPKLTPSMERARKSLPAAEAREEFLLLLEKAHTACRVILVTGETGCGKTTQIPQFILEKYPQNSKIVVAQPRRLAAVGVASRVSLERGESQIGTGSVGYSVRGDSRMGTSTRLLFCTTGVLLRQLQSKDVLKNLSHVVIDEVHERHLDTDVLLAILKKLLSSFPNLNVVLMSATMDADRFASYWGTQTPRMHIPGFTHPVTDFMLEDVIQITRYIPPKRKKKDKDNIIKGYQTQPSHTDTDKLNRVVQIGTDSIDDRLSSSVPSLEERLNRIDEDEIDYTLIALLVQNLLQNKDDDGSILVFLPGVGEIYTAEKTILQLIKDQPISVLLLHGNLQPEKQQQVFLPSKNGTKIILSTNVAETSITIPDCTVVIDTCREKQSSFDPTNRMPLLLERFASQDSLRQRRGRAGRVRPGVCFKLISRSLHSNLPEHTEPEIKRCALDQSVLLLLFLDLEDGSGDFFRSMIDSPSKESFDSALYILEKLGALIQTEKMTTLTPLGKHLAKIPAPPAVGKLLVMGSLLGCRNISIAIAAGMIAGRSPFLRIDSSFINSKKTCSPENASDCGHEKRLSNDQVLNERAAMFKTVGNSDHGMLGKALLLWEKSKNIQEKRECCDRLGLAFNIMKEIKQHALQLEASLSMAGFIKTADCNVNENSWRVVRSAIVSALAPTQIIQVQRPSTKYIETVEGAVAKDGKANELIFFVRGSSRNTDILSISSNDKERVFLHPGSNNFSVGSFSCPWLVYHQMVRTSKAYIYDATECTTYSLLLFGGKMDVQASKGLITLDDWIQLSANARIGSLIGGLKKKIDDLLEEKIVDPSLDLMHSTELKLVTDLLRHDGLGK